MTQRLIGAIANSEEWQRFDAAYASQGTDPLDLPPDRFLNAVYAYLVGGVDRHTQEGQQALRKFEARLWMPPAGVEVTEGPWSAAAETASFQAFKKMIKPDTPIAPDGPVAAGKPRESAASRSQAPAPRRPAPEPARQQQPRRQVPAPRASGRPSRVLQARG